MKQVALNELCQINIGKTPSRSNNSYWGKGHKWVAISDMKNKYICETKEEITDLAIQETKIKIVPKNTVIMSFKLSIGKLAITKEEIYTNEAIASFPIIQTDKITPEYLFYALKTLKLDSLTDRAVMGSTLNKAKLNQLKIPLPDLEMQNRIVKVLKQAEELISNRSSQIQALSSLTQSVFWEMFGDPIHQDKWDVKPLGDFVERIESGWSPKSESFPAVAGQKGVLKLSAVTKGVYQHNKNKALYADTLFKEELAVRSGDLLITRKNTRELVGACAYVFNTPQNLMLPDTIFRIIFKHSQKEVHPIFLWRLLNNPRFRQKVTSLAEGSAGSMPNISKKNLIKLGIVIPPMELQKQFIEIILKIEKQKELLYKGLLLLEENFNSIIQRAFKGDLFKGNFVL
ncbi:restriction endonuclease subunit S [Priestia aryabhattai]|uniref:restriction endonuclease subunit S n=1 Tax=Priestia aryabhattai TaxID=412384 RepID=UPI002452C53A|nr:restriction endonuclease subunit S [Priestia aryabhattai]MDH3111463.1 restriction endonuclease subunit S [Priestia aryabhattai]MDH3129616.1 restriction endonuclease subunit S [Priestia aryabhattai]